MGIIMENNHRHSPAEGGCCSGAARDCGGCPDQEYHHVHNHCHASESDPCHLHDHGHESACGCCHEEAKFDRKTILEIAACVIFAAAGFFVQKNSFWWLALALFLISYLIIGYPVLLETFENFRKRRFFDENLLMTVATVGAFFLGEYPEAVGVMLFFRVGELIQGISVGKSRRSISSLMAVRPDFARLVREEDSVCVSPFEVHPGDLIEVRAGERIPLDGVIEQGSSFLDTAAVTGESVKRRASEGDEVLSGCVNSDGVLRVRVSKPFAESTVSRILQIVEESSAKKAPAEKFITRFCRIYTPAVVGLAVLVALVPPLIAGNWEYWLHTALTFLVISCPCALVLSVPLSYFCGIGACSRQGVLVKGGVVLETAAKLEGVAFDKTGTLTYGDFRVRQILPEDRADQILEACAAAEFYSNHPVAEAVREQFSGRISPEDLSDFSEKAGCGVRVCYRGKEILAGNRKFLAENGVSVSLPESSGTEIAVAEDRRFLGRLIVADSLKENVPEALEAIKKTGISSFALLTGDAPRPAGEIASHLGIGTVCSGLLPGEKADVFRRVSKGKTFAFVGDGINDAPVLSVAPVGISVGSIGSDAAVEASDAVLMRDDLSGIARLKQIGRKTCRTVHWNVAFVLAIKLTAMILGVLGVLPMWGAVFADVGACLLAVLNATLSLRKA